MWFWRNFLKSDLLIALLKRFLLVIQVVLIETTVMLWKFWIFLFFLNVAFYHFEHVSWISPYFKRDFEVILTCFNMFQKWGKFFKKGGNFFDLVLIEEQMLQQKNGASVGQAGFLGFWWGFEGAKFCNFRVFGTYVNNVWFFHFFHFLSYL